MKRRLPVSNYMVPKFGVATKKQKKLRKKRYKKTKSKTTKEGYTLGY